MPAVAVLWVVLVAAGEDAFDARVRPVLEARCVACHAGDEPEGELDIERLAPATPGERATWNAVRRRVRAGEMPPKGEPALAREERETLLTWLDGFLGPDETVEDAGTAVLRRLNRREYAHTIRDLFGVAIEADELPADEVGQGFDTIGAVLATSELLLETHLRLAERVAERAVLLPDAPDPEKRHIAGAKLSPGDGSNAREEARVLYKNGKITFSHALPRAGDYALRVRVHGDQAGDEPCRMALEAAGREMLRADVPEKKGDGRIVEAYAQLAAGPTRITVAFLNDYWSPESEPGDRDRNLVVEWLEVEGPLDPPAPSRYQREELDPQSRGTVDDVVVRLLRRAWRRPVGSAEIQEVVELARGAGSFEEGVRTAIVAALVSPNFLYRPEAGEFPGSPAVLTPHEVAARLSYFLWSSMPDRELERQADKGQLRLRGLVRSMIADPRSQALAEGFATQWLQLGRLERASPDPQRFPEFDEALRASMQAEATMLFDAVLRERRPARALLDPGFTFVDERLAKHYGLSGVQGTAMRRVPLDDGARGGVLGLAAVLTATSYPTRTSPSSRGKFVLEALLGAPPPPPPPGVGVLAEGAHAQSEASLRERLEQHRSDPSCAACHQSIDPIGFGLENLDAIGRWRAREGRHAVDARGAMPDGRAFAGPAELKRLIADDPAFVRCLFERLVVYALGRGLVPADRTWIDAAIAKAGREPTLAGLIEEIVQSSAFGMR